jgi:hypothetical protein
VITGSASFDAPTNLWTYSYVVDNTLGTAPVNEFRIIVNPYAQDPALIITDPLASPDWRVFPDPGTAGKLPGSFYTDPANATGYFTAVTFTAFHNVIDPVTHNEIDNVLIGEPVAVGEARGGFSFTSTFQPVADDGRNTYAVQDVFGYVIAPDDPVAPIALPEPSTLVMASVGIVLVGGAAGVRRRRHRNGRS